MAELVSDVVDGSSLSEDWVSAKTTRAFVVKGVNTGTPTERMIEAFTYTGIPITGDQHPATELSHLYVANKRLENIDSQTFKILCDYAPLDATQLPPSETRPAQISVGGSVTSTQTNKDKDGTDIKLEANSTLKLEEQSGLVTKQIPMVTIGFARHEPDAPDTKARDYVGKLNSASFLGIDSELVLCTRISGISNNGGESYQVQYEFQYNPDGWEATVVRIDPNTGVPHKDVDSSASMTKTVDLYETINFNNLNLQ